MKKETEQKEKLAEQNKRAEVAQAFNLESDRDPSFQSVG